jgi:DNA-binding CsgD family transcriptional regulator
VAAFDRLDRLSPRELEVFKLLRDGPSNREIATALNISERTAKAHVASILEKLSVNSRLQVCMVSLMQHVNSNCRRADTVPKVNGLPPRSRGEIFISGDRTGVSRSLSMEARCTTS